MKGKLATGIAVIVIIGAVIGINMMEPERAAEREIAQQAEAQTDLAEVEEIQAESEAEMAEAEAEDELGEILNQVQSSRNAEDASIESDGDYKVHFECSNGEFSVVVREKLAPLGVKQFRAAIEDGVYNGARFFRVIPGFVVQFGIPGDPEQAAKWKRRTIKDDPVKISNTRGTITFATSGPNSRTTQVFINFGDNSNLDGMGFAPFGEVTEGMSVVDAIYSGHGEKPDQAAIQRSGNRYLEAAYPELDYVIRATVHELDESDNAPAEEPAEEEAAAEDEAA